MNADLQSTLLDIALRLYRGFFLPGDQLSSVSPGSVQSGLISTVVWVGAIVLIVAIYRLAIERQARLARTEVSELPALTGLQLEVLRSHVELPPGHLLTPGDVADTLNMRVSDVERALGSLKKLSLVERTFGAGDGEDGYRLTRPGEVFLAACSRPQSVKETRIEPTLGSL